MTFEHFPNRAGDLPDNDAVLKEELKQAGIPDHESNGQVISESLRQLIRGASGEVKTYVHGNLHGWSFERGWRYWVCTGPGIPLKEASELHAVHGKYARVGGHAGAPSPLEHFKGLGCGSYHVDGPDALKALANTIKLIVERHQHD